MKNILIVLVLTMLSTVSVSAQTATNKAEIDAALKASRKQFALKTAEFEKSLSSHNTQTTQTIATQILDIMRKGMYQTRNAVQAVSGDEQKTAIKHYNDMEPALNNYSHLYQNAAANGKQLLAEANAFGKLL